MAAPVYSVGQVLANTDCNQWFTGLYAYKTGNLVRSTTGNTSDPDLQVTVAANAVYDVRCYVLYSGAAATGMTYGFAVPAGVSGSFGVNYNLAGTGPTSAAYIWTAVPNTAGTPSGNQMVIIEGTLITAGSGGTLAFQWASGTGGNNVTVINGSKLTCVRVG